MKRCYFVIKNVRNFPLENGFIVYAESIVELINVLKEKLTRLANDEDECDIFDIHEGMVIDLGEAFEIPESLCNGKFESLVRDIPKILRVTRLRAGEDDLGWN